MQLLHDGPNDGLLQANDGKMLVNGGEMSVWSYTHLTIIDEPFAIINDHLTIINEHFAIFNEYFTIISSFDHHWEAAPTVLSKYIFLGF